MFGPNVIELCRMADITFVALHGSVGENGKLQAAFDLLGIKYTGCNSFGCALSMNKLVTKQIYKMSTSVIQKKNITMQFVNHLKRTQMKNWSLSLTSKAVSLPALSLPEKHSH